MGYSPWGHKELDMTEATEHSCTQHCMKAPRHPQTCQCSVDSRLDLITNKWYLNLVQFVFLLLWVSLRTHMFRNYFNFISMKLQFIYFAIFEENSWSFSWWFTGAFYILKKWVLCLRNELQVFFAILFVLWFYLFCDVFYFFPFFLACRIFFYFYVITSINLFF